MVIIKRLKSYVRNVVIELKRVNWVKPSDLFKTTIVVIVLSLIVALFIMICDVIFSRILHLVIK